MRKILCAGLCVMDVIVAGVPGDILNRDTAIPDYIITMPGGDAFNVATALARFGLPTVLCGRVGNDANGAFLKGRLTESGAEDALFYDASRPTATSVVLVDDSTERHFLYSAGANDAFGMNDIPDEVWRECDHLHVSGAQLLQTLDCELFELFSRARRLGMTASLDVAYDPSGLGLKKIEPVLGLLDAFMPSFQEASLLTGETDPVKIASALLKAGVKTAVVKLGAEGCCVAGSGGVCFLPAFDCVEIADTNGCGDAFCAGFLRKWLAGAEPAEAALFAGAASAHCMSHAGAGVYCASSEIEGILKRQRENWQGKDMRYGIL